MPLHCTTLHCIALCRYVVERALGASDATQRRGVLVLLDCDALSLARNVRPSASDTYRFCMPAPAVGERSPFQRGQWAAAGEKERRGVPSLSPCPLGPLKALRLLLSSLSSHMPVRLGGVLVVRPPGWLGGAWGAFGRLVRPKLRERVVMMSDPAQLRSILDHEVMECDTNAMEWNGMEWNGMEWNGMECRLI